jgi:hypothetical protein
VRGGAPAVQQPRLAEEHGAGADRGERLHLPPALADPFHQTLIVDLAARAPAARHHQDVEGRAGIEGDIGDDLEAARGDHDVRALGHEQDLEGRRLFAARLLVQARHRKHLEGSAEVENLHVRKDENAHALAVHSCLLVCTPSPYPLPRESYAPSPSLRERAG